MKITIFFFFVQRNVFFHSYGLSFQKSYNFGIIDVTSIRFLQDPFYNHD